jgi:hypothetical protein
LKRRILLAFGVAIASSALAQGSPPTTRLRGTIERADAKSLQVKTADGRVVTLGYAADFTVNEVVPVDPAAIQSGTFVGTTAVPGPDGTLSAVEVHVFPEEARGTGEGHRPWDLQPGSTMTNATVSAIKPGPNDRTMTLRYKDGEKTIRVPNGVPIVTVKPSDRSLMVPGAKVIVTQQVRDGQAVATRAVVGRNGFAPPM